jgi:hypothetical protein|tara:strand:+ start:2552 stop:2827 length:276 start_codon:yes stop_codon:yes gene_type:complete
MPKKNNSIKEAILVSILPTDNGFACTVLPSNNAPQVESYAVALTIAHGMVKVSVEEPDYIFDKGIQAMQETSSENRVSFEDLLTKRKEKLH